MTDLIAQNKPLGVLLAKAFISKENLDALLKKDQELAQQLANIGYTVKLSPEATSSLQSSVEAEKAEIRKKVENVQKAAEIFANMLTSNLKHLAEKSKEDTETVYHLSQILFLWDEQIDWEDFQKSGGDLSKIRESVFYRAACHLLQEIVPDELSKLKKQESDKNKFETILTELQLQHSDDDFLPDKYLTLIENLRKNKLSRSESIRFLLSLESVLFIKFTESLIWKKTDTESQVFKSISNLMDGITHTRNLFNLDEDLLENELNNYSKDLIMKVGFDLFAK